MINLKVLNLRYNALANMNVGQLDYMKELVELILEDNQLTELEKTTFNQQGKLELLRLGNNKLTELPEDLFKGTVQLKVLRLENNGLTKLEPKLFDSGLSLTLEELHLQRNALTELVEGIFASLKGLKRLYLQVNPDLKLIPKSIFAKSQPMVTSLEKMSMLGSASACTKASKNTDVQCTCAVGYVDGTPDQKGSYCIPVVCPETIAGLDEKAKSACGAGNEYLSTCEATCVVGFVGRATYTCQPKPNSQDGFLGEGQWVTDVAVQCVAKSCPADIPARAFGDNTIHSRATKEDLKATPTCSGEQLKYGSLDNCDVPCTEGFLPKDGTSTLFTCGPDQLWIPAGAPETKLVCERVDCGPKITKGLKPGRFEYISMAGTDRVIDGCTGRDGETVYEEECRVQCAEGFREYETEEATGFPVKKDYVCSKNGDWEFPDGSLDCRGKRCGRNAAVAENVIARCLGDVTFGGDKCGISCENGFKPTGQKNALVRDYCQVYQASCPVEFEGEFGDGKGDTDDPLKICYFESERSTIGTFPLETDAERSQNTIACRVSYVYNPNDDDASAADFQLDCNKGRLANNEQCADRVCRDGSVECLTCNKDGTWQESELKCKPVECPVGGTRGRDDSGFDAIRDAACENIGTFTVKAREECLAKFDRLAAPESGTNCAESNEFDNVCPISCKHGYNPKNSPFRCDADQLAQGVWVGNLDCNPVQCPIVIKDATVDGTVYLEGVDPDALVTSLVEDPKCTESGTRLQFQPLAGGADAANQSASGVTIQGECATTGSYDPTEPTKIQATCSDNDVTETYTLKCDDPSWAVESVDSGPLFDRGVGLFDWQKNGSRFCRRDCGEFLGFAVEQDRRQGYCQGYAEGDQCIGICKLNRNYSVTLLCDWQTQTWVADPNENYEYDENNQPTDVLYDGNICENLFTTTSTTTTTIPLVASSRLTAGAQAAVIVVPLIILLTALFVVLYYFGCLKAFGLQPTQPKHEIYGQIYGEMFGAAGNDIYAAAVETRKRNIKIAKQKKKEFKGPSIAGRTGGKGNKAVPRRDSLSGAGPGKIAGRSRTDSEIGRMETNPMFKAGSIAGRARSGSGAGATATTAFN